MKLVLEGHVLDLDRRELRRGAEPVALEPQVFDLLAYLVEHRARVVGKEELIAKVWNGRVVSDSTVSSRINAVRRALGDSGDAQRMVRTYARKGIRFVGQVLAQGGEDAGADAPRGSPVARGRPCIAVLPFANLSGSPEQDYFADGVTEDIITGLSRNRALCVIARNSSFAFRGATGVRHIGRELGADYLVEGSVRRSGSRVRITVHLSEAASERQIWTERYERDVREIFSLQDELSASVVARLAPEVERAEEGRAAGRPPGAFDAWDYFRLGTRAFHRSDPESNREAQRFFTRAIEIDPELAQAHGYLSYAIVLGMIYFDEEPDPGRLAAAVAIGRRGVAADERDALARFMFGRALLAQGDYDEALAQLAVARELNPELAVVHCGLADSLAYAGRVDEAIAHFQTAIDLSPHDPMRWAFLSYRALAHLFARQFEEAAHWSELATRVPRCHSWAFAHRVAALGYLEGRDELRRAVDGLARLAPGFSREQARRRLFFVKSEKQLSIYLEGLRRAGIP